MSARRLKLRQPEPTERQVLNAVLRVLEVLRRQGRVDWYMRVNSGMGWARGGTLADGSPRFRPVRLAPTGTADVIGTLPGGRSFFLECKRPSGALRPEQAAFLDARIEAGALAAVVRSSEDVIRLLEEA